MNAPHELTHCSQCRDNAEFYYVVGEGWLSLCCSARAIPVDVEPPDA